MVCRDFYGEKAVNIRCKPYMKLRCGVIFTVIRLSIRCKTVHEVTECRDLYGILHVDITAMGPYLKKWKLTVIVMAYYNSIITPMVLYFKKWKITIC